MTHARFGLGDAQFSGGLGEDQIKEGLGEDQIKEGLGEDQIKEGLGEDQIKEGLGEDQIKEGLGILSRLAAAYPGNGAPVNPIGTVTRLYQQIALALQLSEEALSKLESVVRLLLTNGSGREDDDYKQRGIEQVKRSFLELKDMVANAKQITVGVLADPAYGLGPSSQTSQSTVPREQLAIVGGLSPRLLHLL
jgi:hypothetical protein